MRRPRRSTPLRALALTLPSVLLVTPLALAPAQADPGVPPSPSGPPEVSAPAAEQALDNASALLSGVVDGATEGLGAAASGPADTTLALLDLRNQLPQLNREDRREARALLARPDAAEDYDPTTPGVQDPDAYAGGQWSTADQASASSTCDNTLLYGVHPFCVHWVGNSASPQYTSAAAVSETVAIMQRVWDTEIGSMGYRAPLPDAGRGGSDKLDVYLADTGNNDIFGYAIAEFEPKASAGYLVLENDFSEFANPTTTATEFRQVTAAHEFFHLVQFAYDSYENSWLMESTATWMEERIYDSVDDNRNYIRHGSLRQPRLPLDTHNGGAEYGTWVFHELYSQHLGAGVVREVWQYAASTGQNYLWSLNTALTRHGWSLTTALRTFGGASLAPSLFLQEGGYYPSAELSGSWKLTTRTRSTGLRSVRLNHLAGSAYDFRPGASLTGRWNLRIAIDAPSSGSTAYVIVFFANGTAPRRIPVGLNSLGNKTFSVPFRYGTVRRVALDVRNATTTNGRTTTFRATAWR